MNESNQLQTFTVSEIIARNIEVGNSIASVYNEEITAYVQGRKSHDFSKHPTTKSQLIAYDTIKYFKSSYNDFSCLDEFAISIKKICRTVFNDYCKSFIPIPLYADFYSDILFDFVTGSRYINMFSEVRYIEQILLLSGFREGWNKCIFFT